MPALAQRDLDVTLSLMISPSDYEFSLADEWVVAVCDPKDNETGNRPRENLFCS